MVTLHSFVCANEMLVSRIELVQSGSVHAHNISKSFSLELYISGVWNVSQHIQTLLDDSHQKCVLDSQKRKRKKIEPQTFEKHLFTEVEN